MNGSGVAGDGPSGWVNNLQCVLSQHQSVRFSTLTRNKNRSGARSRSFEGRLNLDRTDPHVDKFSRWLNLCGGAEFKQSKAGGVGSLLCEVIVNRPAGVFGASAIPQNPRPNGGVRARARDGGPAMPLGRIAPLRAVLVRPCPLRWTGATLQTQDRLAGRRSHRTVCVVSDAKTFFVGPE